MRRFFFLCVVSGPLVLAGCGGAEKATDSDRARDAETRRAQGKARPASGTRPAEKGGAAEPREVSGRTVEAMVGHIGGKPLYASEVLEPLSDQLKALGKNPGVSASAFRKRARRLIAGRLQQMVSDRLLLGEAQRSLSTREKKGLKRMMEAEEQELLRRWGEGSRAFANLRLRREQRQNVEGAVEERRRTVLVKRHLRKELKPKVDISRRDIERHYREHEEKYNPPPKRTIRLIRAEGEKAAKAIARKLEKGAAFEQVARSEHNGYRPDEGGLFAEDVEGERIFGHEKLNKATLALDEGEHSERIELGGGYAWVSVEKKHNPAGKPLKSVQREIEQKLQRKRFRELSREYRQKIMKEGLHSSVSRMARQLVEVAVARYEA
jgi:parvulin-like peptidyl-prolyl isomerase